MYKQANIGFFAIGLGAYWPQISGMKEELLQYTGRIEALVRQWGNVHSAGMVDSEASARAANRYFRQNEVDLVFCFSATYSTSQNIIFAVRNLDVPVILLNLQAVDVLDFEHIAEVGDWLKTCTCAGLPEMTATLIRHNIPFDSITGTIQNDEEVQNAIRQWCHAAKVKRLLYEARIGQMGGVYEGMMDLYVDRSNLLYKIGTYIEAVGYDQLCERMHHVSETELALAIQEIESKFEATTAKGKALRDAATVLVALRQLIADKNFHGLSFHHQGQANREVSAVVATSNVAFSICTTDGVPCCVEGDAKACIVSLILKAISGHSQLAELYSMDFTDDVCIVGHSGSGDISISSRKPTLKETGAFHGKTGGGFLTQFFVKNGPVTLLALTQDAQGSYQLVAAQGRCEAGSTLQLGDTNSRIRFKKGLRSFMHEWSAAGASHHSAITLGHWADTLVKVAKLLNVQITVI